MNLIVFINKPEVRIRLKPGVASQCETLEDFFEYVRSCIRDELTDPKNFRIPADEILKLSQMYDKVRRNKDAI